MVVSGLTLTGDDAANYNLAYPSNLKADITQLATTEPSRDNPETILLASLGTNNLMLDQRTDVSVPFDFTVTGNTTTIELGDALPINEEVNLESLPVFASAGGELTLDSQVTVQLNGSSLSASRAKAQNASVTSPNLETAVITEQTQIDITFDNGLAGQLTVTMTEAGTLIIETPKEAQTTDKNQVILWGLVAAKRTGVDIAKIKAIVIQPK